MDASAAASLVRGFHLPPPMVPPSTRKEWRAVSSDGADGAGPLNADSWSGSLENGDDALKQQLEVVSQKREELQRAEVELVTKVMEDRMVLECMLKEQAAANSKLKEHIEERESYIMELKGKLDEKDKELRALKKNNEEALAKEEYLTKQNQELASFRMEHDNSEAERAQSMKHIHDLEDHIHEKDRAIRNLEEQNRVAQESIIYKEKQLLDAQSLISNAMEREAQIVAWHTENNDRFSQYWMTFQHQYTEMEHNLLRKIRQLESELADEKEKNMTSKETSRLSSTSTTESLTSNGIQLIINGNGLANESSVHASNGGKDASANVEHTASVPVFPSALLGMSGFMASGQMAGIHPYLMQPAGVPQPLMSTWTNQQPFQSSLKMDGTENSETAHELQNQENSVLEKNGPDLESKVVVQHGGQLLRTPDISSGNVDRMILKDPVGELNELKVQKDTVVTGNSHINELIFGQLNLVTDVPISTNKSSIAGNNGMKAQNGNLDGHCGLPPSAHESVRGDARQIAPEPTLLDERSLLACIVRSIAAGSDAGVRISTTLMGRLEKFIVPLHWSDYKKQYGNLETFVAQHHELFVIEGDTIKLREGAQQIIAATTAAAKVAAAASASQASCTLPLPLVAVTPVAQNIRQKRAPAINQRPGVDVTVSRTVKNMQEVNSVTSQFEQTLVQNVVRNFGGTERENDKGSSNGRYSQGAKQPRRSTVGYTSRR